MKQTPAPQIILIIFLLSVCYWTYLAFTTTMTISADAVNYEQLGRLLQHNDLSAYFKDGPRREPIYPLIVSISMRLEALCGVAYTKIMAVFGVVFLLFTQILAYTLLRKLNVRLWICAVVLIYSALSPALNNTAFSLYSEISAIPLVLLLTLMIARSFEAIISKNILKAFLAAVCLGLTFVVLTLIKSPFELIFFIFTAIYLFLLLRTSLQKNRSLFFSSLIFLVSLLAIYEIPISGYKMLNKIYNGNYAITNRGSWALYGGCALKTEPMTGRKILTAIAHIPGVGACTKFFSEDECSYWEPNHTSDSLGLTEYNSVMRRVPAQEADKIILSDCKKRIQSHPFQFVLLSSFDWIKMFFWESTKIGFVDYPHWLQKIYNKGVFKDSLRLFISLVSLCSFLLIFKFIKNPLKLFDLKHSVSQEEWLRFTSFILILFYTLFHALFNTITRWALPIAPLYFICIGYALQQLCPQSKNKNHSS